MKARAWCFTHNNPVFDTVYGFLRPSTWPGVKLCVYQLEVAPETGRYHLQGYVEFTNPRAMEGVKSLSGMGNTVHLEPRRGTGPQAVEYCSKDDSRVAGPWWFPSQEEVLSLCAQQGKRNDLAIVRERIVEGSTMKDLWREPELFPVMVRNYRAFAVFRGHHVPERQWQPVLITLIGPTRCGKTRWAWDFDPNLYCQPPGDWWDGYDGQQTVLLDEMYGGRFKFTYLLQLLDRYPMQVPVKGGFANFAPRTIIMTSNVLPSEWYDGVKFNWRDSPLRARLEEAPSLVYYCGHSEACFVPRYGLSDAYLDIGVLDGQVPVAPLLVEDYPVYAERILAFGEAVERYPLREGEELPPIYPDDPRPSMDVDLVALEVLDDSE